MIELREVVVHYAQGRSAVTPLNGVTASLGPGALALMGPSGSGKSTLLRVVAGLQVPDEGSVVVNGTSLDSAGNGTGDPRVALVHQDYRLIEFLSVRDNLRLCAELHGQEIDEATVKRTLGFVGLNGFGHRQPATLSGGEQQRVAIARSIVSGAEVLLADEPSGALDVDNTKIITDLLIRLSTETELLVVVATHDPSVAERLPSCWFIRDGRVSLDETHPAR